MAPPYSVNVSGQHLIANELNFSFSLILSNDDFRRRDKSSYLGSTLSSDEI